MAQAPSKTLAEAAQRFGQVIVDWASGASAMGIPVFPLPTPAVLVPMFLAGSPLEAIMAAFWPTLVFPGAIVVPTGPPLVNPLAANTPDAAAAALALATAMDVNAHLQMVTFPGAPPVVVPIL